MNASRCAFMRAVMFVFPRFSESVYRSVALLPSNRLGTIHFSGTYVRMYASACAHTGMHVVMGPQARMHAGMHAGMLACIRTSHAPRFTPWMGVGRSKCEELNLTRISNATKACNQCMPGLIASHQLATSHRRACRCKTRMSNNPRP